jgi:hypothetical protein
MYATFDDDDDAYPRSDNEHRRLDDDSYPYDEYEMTVNDEYVREYVESSITTAIEDADAFLLMQ